jgi:Leucine-rich repeat (LRR) protein
MSSVQPSFLSYLKPWSSDFQACHAFNTISSRVDKVKIGILTGLATIFTLGILTAYVFRKSTEKLVDITTSKVQGAAEARFGGAPGVQQKLGNSLKTAAASEEKKGVESTELVLTGKNMSFLPAGVTQKTSLTRLDVHNNQLTSLPKDIGNLKNLKRLEVDQNRLQELPDSIGEMKELEVLLIDQNLLEELPKSIEKLTKLRTVQLFGNPLKSFPALSKNEGLRNLYIDVNQAKKFEEELQQLSSKHQVAINVLTEDGKATISFFSKDESFSFEQVTKDLPKYGPHKPK